MATNTLSTRETLRQELEATRLAYHELLEAIPEWGWERPTANPAWNVRQTMFHMTLAPRFLPGDVAMLRRGWVPKVPAWLFDLLNKWYTRWVGSRQTPAGLAAEYDKRHAAVLALLETIRPEEWALAGEYPAINENLSGSRTIAEMFHYLTVHFEEHAADIGAAMTKPRKPPQRAGRLLFRAPIYLYRIGLGWLLGERFLLLNHVGRKSGLARQAVLEVVATDPATDTYYVASGWGRASHWFKNVQANPEVTIKVGRRELAARAEILDREQSGEMMVDYARRNPRAAQALSRMVGLAVDGSEEEFREIGGEHIPFVALHRESVLQKSPEAKELIAPVLLAGGVLVGVGELWRRVARSKDK